jgi:hypothetical protein
MVRYYNKGLNKKSTYRPAMSGSQQISLLKSEELCTKCVPTTIVGVEKKHNSYDRYLNRIRKQAVAS